MEREELEKLEKMHKKALARKVAGIHRSTKSTLRFLEGPHLFLRDHLRWYYRWHTFAVSTFVHWLIVIAAISGVIYIGFSISGTLKKISQIPQKHLLVTGLDIGTDKAAILADQSNIKFNKFRLELKDKNTTIGFIRKKADLEEVASWKNVEWSTVVPEGTTIVYRFKVADDDKQEVWDKTSWSPYYSISDKNVVKTTGVPILKSRFILTEITLEGDQEKGPTLNYLKFGYAPFRENKIVAFLRDKTISGLQRIFKYLEKKEGIQ